MASNWVVFFPRYRWLAVCEISLEVLTREMSCHRIRSIQRLSGVSTPRYWSDSRYIGVFCFLAWQWWKEEPAWLVWGSGGSHGSVIQPQSQGWRLSRELRDGPPHPPHLETPPSLPVEATASITEVGDEKGTRTCGRFLECCFGLEPSFLSWWKYWGCNFRQFEAPL